LISIWFNQILTSVVMHNHRLPDSAALL